MKKLLIFIIVPFFYSANVIADTFEATAIGEVGITSTYKKFFIKNAKTKQEALDSAILKCRSALELQWGCRIVHMSSWNSSTGKQKSFQENHQSIKKYNKKIKKIRTNELLEKSKTQVASKKIEKKNTNKLKEIFKKKEKNSQKIAKEIKPNNKKKDVDKEIKKFFKKNKEAYDDKNSTIDFEDVIKLGTPIIITDLPKGMKEKLGKSCVEFLCRTKKATTIMARSFKRSQDYNNRKPENMIQAMAFFELFYMGRLKENKLNLERYKKNYKQKDKLNFTTKVVFMADEKKIRSLIDTNKGRISMREALGMDIELDPATAIKRFWYLGELLGLGEQTKVKVSKEMKQRNEIVKRYQKTISQIKKQIEDDKEKEEKKEKK
jgi:hypothetical protein